MVALITRLVVALIASYGLQRTALWLIKGQQIRSSVGLSPFLLSTWGIFGVLTYYSGPELATYLFFVSALSITIFTDSYALLISDYVTLYLIPMAWMLSYLGILPISLTNSMYTSIGAYLFLRMVAYLAKKIMKQDAMGSGDAGLLAFIGAWTGFYGCWFALMFGSILGSVFGLLHIISNRFFTRSGQQIVLPFGAFLGMATLPFIVWSHIPAFENFFNAFYATFAF